MYEYELHRYRFAELIRHAENERRARAALRAGRTTEGDAPAATDPAGPDGRLRGQRRHRHTRAA